MSNYPAPSRSELRQFMDAIAKTESGGSDDPYTVLGPKIQSKYGRARGKYQIMSEIWPGWAAEAGYAGADWRDPDIQEAVAEHKFSKYYERYGRWDLVAVAWFAGPGNANKAERAGVDSLQNLSDGFTSVPNYVNKTLKSMGTGDPTTADVQRNIEETGGPPRTPEGESPPARTPTRNMAQAAFAEVHRVVQQNPGNPENRTMMQRALGNFFGQDPVASSTAVVDRARGESPEEQSPTGPQPPTETGGVGMSGVR